MGGPQEPQGSHGDLLTAQSRHHAAQKTWSRDVVLCTDGRARLRAHDRERLERHGIPVRQDRIERLEGHEGVLERIVFHGGEALARRGIFFSTGQNEACSLAAKPR